MAGKVRVEWGGHTALYLQFVLLSQNSSSACPNMGVTCQAARPDLQGQLTQGTFCLEISNR